MHFLEVLPNISCHFFTVSALLALIARIVGPHGFPMSVNPLGTGFLNAIINLSNVHELRLPEALRLEFIFILLILKFVR